MTQVSGISKSDLRDLILSVGTHRRQRRLSPIEAAELFHIEKAGGKTNQQLADMVLLKDTTMVNRFLSLLELSPELRHLVDWGQSDSTISFTAAAELSHLEFSDQECLAEAVLKYSLTKSEVIQIVQIRKRSRKDIETCIREVLRLRPQIVRKYVFIGAIFEEKIASCLKRLKQCERDGLLKKVVGEMLYDIEWSGRLGWKRFSLVGAEGLAKQLRTLEPDFEHVINQKIGKEIVIHE